MGKKINRGKAQRVGWAKSVQGSKVTRRLDLSVNMCGRVAISQRNGLAP